MRNLKVGLFGIGLDTYWPQFAGLEQRLIGYLQQVESKLERPGVEVVNLGLIDSPPKALEAGHQFRQADVDLIFLHVTTYALSSTVLPVVQRAKDAGDHSESAAGPRRSITRRSTKWGIAPR
jgi:L-arabinose isomerase